MSYNKELETRIEDVIISWPDMGKRVMFGGVCYMIRGNLCFGIIEDFLIVRLGKDQAEEKLKQDNVLPFDVTGRPMKAWVMVDKNGYQTEEQLKGWLKSGWDFTETLPPKLKASY